MCFIRFDEPCPCFAFLPSFALPMIVVLTPLVLPLDIFSFPLELKKPKSKFFPKGARV